MFPSQMCTSPLSIQITQAASPTDTGAPSSKIGQPSGAPPNSTLQSIIQSARLYGNFVAPVGPQEEAAKGMLHAKPWHAVSARQRSSLCVHDFPNIKLSATSGVHCLVHVKYRQAPVTMVSLVEIRKCLTWMLKLKPCSWEVVDCRLTS